MTNPQKLDQHLRKLIKDIRLIIYVHERQSNHNHTNKNMREKEKHKTTIAS